MIVLFALLGAMAGWLVCVIGDYLIRFSNTKVAHDASSFRPPAVVRLIAQQASNRHTVAEALVEVVSAAVFAFIYVRHGASAQALWLTVMYAFFALITIMDYKYRVILNILTYPGVVIALVINLVILRQPILPIALGMVFAFGVFYLTAMIKPGGLGGGDVKLAALLGAAFGFPQVLFVLIVSAAASAIAIVLLVARRSSPRPTIPYAPFLCLGAVVILLFGPMLALP
jgi:prepilin signal peptidase PulO-like enzyme (type II secretory pathway)